MRECHQSARFSPSGALHVDDERACPDEGEDDLLGLVARIDIAMNQSRRDVEEPARFHVRALAPARPELEPGATAGDVAQHISIAVVVPAGRHATLCACTYEHRTRRVERELTDESRRRRSRCQPVGADGSYLRRTALRSDAARLQLPPSPRGSGEGAFEGRAICGLAVCRKNELHRLLE